MKRPRPEPKRDSIDDFIYSLFNGFKPNVIDISESGRVTDRSVRWKITRKIGHLVDTYFNVKIGVTGDSLIRTDQTDYRGNYSKMFLIYKSRSKKNISDLEVHYINKFYGKTDNKSKTKASRLSTFDGYYYLYVVTN